MSEIIPNMPYAEYAKRHGVNASLLKIVHGKSLMHARAYLDGKWKEESDALDFGHCFHSLGLENREDFVTIPANYTNDKGEEKPWNWNAKVCQKWGDEQGDKIPLKEAEVTAVRSMAARVHAELGERYAGRNEISLFGEIKGHPVKCRIDLLPDDESLPIIDLKSCASAEPSKFLRSSIDLGYLLQAAFTIDVARACGIDRDQFDLLAIESEAPHAPCRLSFKDEPLSLLRVGRIHYRAAFMRLVNAQKSGNWQSYGTHPAENFAPVWMRDEISAAA